MDFFGNRRTDTNLHRMLRVDKPFFDGVKKNGSVSITLTEVIGPSINMSIEVYQCEWATTSFGGGPQQWQCDRMVASEDDKMSESRCLLFYEKETFYNVAEGNAEVANVGDTQCCRVDPPVRVVAVHQHAARLTDCGGSEARATPIGGAQVKGDARNAEQCITVST
jgi:hypothetical protein